MRLTKNDKVIIFQAARQVFYFAIIMAFILFIYQLSALYRNQTFAENGIIENIQLGLLFATALSFALQAEVNKDYRIVLLLLASASVMACFRELDKFFDVMLPGLSWKLGFIFPLIALFWALADFKHLREPLKRFLISPAFNMMFCAMIIIIPVAQCIGHGPFVRNVLEIQDISAIKELFEEASEALGYMLIFLASLECIWSMPKK